LADGQAAVDHTHQLALWQSGILLGVEPAEVAHSDYSGSDFLHGAAIMPRVSKTIPQDTKTARKGKSPSVLGFELRTLALALTLGVLVMP
jgi:hypothetical protein